MEGRRKSRRKMEIHRWLKNNFQGDKSDSQVLSSQFSPQGVEISDDIWFDPETISSLITLEVVLQSARMSNINGNVEERRMRCNTDRTYISAFISNLYEVGYLGENILRRGLTEMSQYGNNLKIRYSLTIFSNIILLDKLK